MMTRMKKKPKNETRGTIQSPSGRNADREPEWANAGNPAQGKPP